MFRVITRRQVLAAMTLVALAGCGGGSSTSSGGGGNPELERRIVVVGDSIGDGYGASVAYPDLVASMTGIPVINISKDGTNAEDGVARIPGLIEEHKPQYMVFLLGTNNASGSGGRVSGAVNSLQYAANATSAAGVTGIIVTLPPSTRSLDENNMIREINNGIRRIDNARIADAAAGMNGGDMSPDGKHPNDRGQRKIADAIVGQIN